MASQYAFERISEADFDNILSQYPETVPSKLSDLEEQRLSTIPAALAYRKKEGVAFLNKAEVATLVDWKLYVHHPVFCDRHFTWQKNMG